MKALVFSDSHNAMHQMRNIISLLEKSIKKGEFGHVIHLGDCYEDSLELERLHANLGLKFHRVKGNNDYTKDVPDEAVIAINGKKILITHGHRLNVNYSNLRVSLYAEEIGVDICLFGHTHVPAVFYNAGIMFMNPGSVAYPRSFKIPTYGVLEITDSGVVNTAIVGRTKGAYRPIDLDGLF